MKLSTREKFIALVDNDKLKKSDAIILLEGDGTNRVQKTVQLYNEGWSDLIVFSGGISDLKYGSYPKGLILSKFIELNFDLNKLIFEEKSQHTFDQAINIIEMCKINNWKRIILVASHYHQYRAYLTFLKVVTSKNLNIELINAPVHDLSWFEESGWGKRFDLLTSEFLKIDKYSKLGHLATFKQAIEYQKWKEKQV